MTLAPAPGGSQQLAGDELDGPVERQQRDRPDSVPRAPPDNASNHLINGCSVRGTAGVSEQTGVVVFDWGVRGRQEGVTTSSHSQQQRPWEMRYHQAQQGLSEVMSCLTRALG